MLGGFTLDSELQFQKWEEARGRYKSPFEVFKIRYARTKFVDMYPVMQYSGSLANTFSDLRAALLQPEAGLNFINIALCPPRIIRAAIDYKIGYPKSPQAEKIVKDAINLGIEIYKGSDGLVQILDKVRVKIRRQAPGLLGQVVNQEADYPSWHATDPDKSFNTAWNLSQQFSDQDMFLIALGHGGTAAGIDVFLNYCSISGSLNSRLYVIRYSRKKMHDEEPHVSTAEKNFLQSISKGKQVVVFDEDQAFGITLSWAKGYLEDNIFRRRSTVAVSNINLGWAGKELKESDS